MPARAFLRRLCNLFLSLHRLAGSRGYVFRYHVRTVLWVVDRRRDTSSLSLQRRRLCRVLLLAPSAQRVPPVPPCVDRRHRSPFHHRILQQGAGAHRV